MGRYVQPQNLDEWHAKGLENTTIQGAGLDLVIGLCCPYCSAPHFIDVPADKSVAFALQEGGKCRECGRAARLIVRKLPGRTVHQMIRTEGPELPEWLWPVYAPGKKKPEAEGAEGTESNG